MLVGWRWQYRLVHLMLSPQLPPAICKYIIFILFAIMGAVSVEMVEQKPKVKGSIFLFDPEIS
jgi:hypothetical protein